MTSVSLPQDLDEYLRAEEKAIADITPGAEKIISWAGRRGRKTPVSIIYLHGFTATRQEIAPVYEMVGKELGANVFYTRLAGHGVPGDALGKVSLDAWTKDAWEAYEIGNRIGERVVVAATSTGAPLALWLAAQETPQIAALVLASANMKPAASLSGILLSPRPLRDIVLALMGPYQSVTSMNESDARYWTKRYPSKSLFTMMAAVTLGRRVPVEKIGVPSLWLYAEKDDVVSLPELKKFYQRMGSATKRLVDVPGATGHVLAGDILSPQTTGMVVQTVVSFLRGLDVVT
jgi:esterase/lipase